MDISTERFFQKHMIEAEDILYVLRRNSKTVIHLNDGRFISTYVPLKTIISQLKGLHMLNINKGVYVNEAEIVSIERGRYTMTDGASFQGRVRTPGAHSRKAQLLNRHLPSPIPLPKNLVERFSILDHMPLPFCVIEIVFDENGHGIDFIFRYCNDALLRFENKSKDEIINHSCFEVFHGSEKKWAISYADVALNGVTREIMEFDSAHSRTIKAYCFQPQEGYCACVLLQPNEHT